MRAKEMLATMSHEIRSPLSGVVSMAEIFSTTNLDKEQRQLLNVMLSSGDLVLQLINDILDLSKVESGVMKLEVAKFRPREVVKHVLQTAAASLQKILTLEGHVADDVPAEVIGDVLRIRQILTNLISNAIKFTHEGKVGMKLYVVPAPSLDRSTVSVNVHEQDKCVSLSQSCCDQKGFHEEKHGEGPYKNHTLDDEPKTPIRNGASIDGGEENHLQPDETIVWICCDVYDTGIGILEKALPTLFKKYMQVGADTAQKYGGTGLGLAICKQLVELMGYHFSVSSREHHGSTFTFILLYKVSPAIDNSDDPDELSDMADHDAPDDANDDDTSSEFFQFQPCTLGSLFASSDPSRAKKLSNNIAFNASYKLNGLLENGTHPSRGIRGCLQFPSSNIATKEVTSLEDACSVDGANTSLEHESSMRDSPDSAKKITVGSDREIQCHNKENGKFRNPDMNSTHPSRESNIGETIKAIDSQEASEMWERTNRSTQCSPSNSPEIPKSVFKPKIPLVEDNKINLGHTIDVVNNGVEAVRAVQSCTYDLVLMDVCMLVMDGLQATRLIRSFEETGSWDAAVKAGIEQFMPPNDQKFESSKKRMPIIAMTANTLAESAYECFANGMDSFVSKPVTFQKLKECLDQYF
ncbi:Histidine kinase 5 [Camellia lanceoleosa]|uniref:Histidine kinase 5 n=1 Tax=Camellia lanceoleosa TaxID=1840588 RepID=A0ACC0FNN9_9ERIC|nr:Histidine kinase 5 [Camellia lanceoleosa]